MQHIILNSRVVIAEYPVGTFKCATDAVTQAANDLYQFGNISRYNYIPTTKAEAVILYLDSDAQEYVKTQTSGNNFDKYAAGLLWDRNKDREDLYTPHKDEEDIEREQAFEQESQKSMQDEAAESEMAPTSSNDKRFKNIDDTEYFQRLQDINTKSPEYLQYLKSIGYEGNAPEPQKIKNMEQNAGLTYTEEETAGESSDLRELNRTKYLILSRAYTDIKDVIDSEFNKEEVALLQSSEKIPQEIRDYRNLIIDTIVETYGATRPELISFMKEHQLPMNFTKEISPMQSESVVPKEESAKPIAETNQSIPPKSNIEGFTKLYVDITAKIKASRENWEAKGKTIPNYKVENSLHSIFQNINTYNKFIDFLKTSGNYDEIFNHKLYSKDDEAKFSKFGDALLKKIEEYKAKNLKVTPNQVSQTVNKQMGDKSKLFMDYIKDTGKDKQLFA